jgi:CoA:oxalate CoA-transferase
MWQLEGLDLTQVALPIEGLRVLDLSQAVSGPYAGRILADLGADVVKVEWPRGDVTNVFGRRIAGRSGLFTQMNASKRGVGVDLSVPEGVQLVRELADRADVVVENFRPGVLARAGLDYTALSSRNPRLVMLSISGFGQKSPESTRQAYAPVIHAESGLLARQAMLDDRAPADIGLALGDTVAALHGTVAVLAALLLRQSTGRGQHIDLSMLEAMVASDDYVHNSIDGMFDLYAHRGKIWPAPGGPIMIAADPKTLWMRLAAHTEMRDPSPTGADLEAKIAARARAVSAWVRSFSNRAQLIAELEAANLAWADLRTTDTVLASPTLEAAQVVAYVDDHAGGRRGVVRMPYRFSDAECKVRGPAPMRGQHNQEVLADWTGLSRHQIEALEKSRALTSDVL